MAKVQGKQIATGTIKAANVDTTEIPTLGSGGTFTGGVTVGGAATISGQNPTAGTHAATKEYVDNAVTGAQASPVYLNKNMAANNTSADGHLATDDSILLLPAHDGYVTVLVNGVEVEVGDGVKTKPCYFSDDNGATAKSIANIAQGDFLFWNGSIAGYQLTAGSVEASLPADRIDFLYNSIDNVVEPPVEEGPFAYSQSVETEEETPVEIDIAGDTDDRAITSYTVTQLPENGSLVSVGGSRYVYKPMKNFSGYDYFKFTAFDGVNTSNEATISIEVDSANDAPVANNITVVVQKNQARNIGLSASDVDSNTLTYVAVAGPTNGGSLAAQGGLVVQYTPPNNYVGADSFTYRVSDGTTNSNIATVTIDVRNTSGNGPTSFSNLAPTAFDIVVNTRKNASANIALSGFDPNNDPLIYTITGNPTNGTLTGSGATRKYTPNADYVGADSFTYTVSDGLLTSNTATCNITVAFLPGGGGAGGNGGVPGNPPAPPNNAPIANDQAQTLAEDTQKQITLSGTNPAGNPVTYEILGGPANGVLKGNGRFQTYKPNANFNGADAFTFVLKDKVTNKTSRPGTVTITVTPVNDAPVALNQTVNVKVNAARQITLQATDIDNVNLTYSIAAHPMHGTVVITNVNTGACTYTPNAGYVGADAFTFRANDGALNSNVAVVTLNVVNGATPVADDQTFNIIANQPLTDTLSANDADGDPLTYSESTDLSNKFSVNANGQFTFTPSAAGTYVLTWKANDGVNDSNIATATVVVRANGVPSIPDQAIEVVMDNSIAQDNPSVVTLVEGAAEHGYDNGEDDHLTFIQQGPSPANASEFEFADQGNQSASVTYKPTAGFVGTNTVQWKVQDPGATSTDTGTITYRVNNGPPIALSATYVVMVSVDFTLQATDADGQPWSGPTPLTWTIVQTPNFGVLTYGAGWTGGVFVGNNPSSINYNVGNNSVPGNQDHRYLTFKVSTAASESNLATVHFALKNHEGPTAVADSYTVKAKVPYPLQIEGRSTGHRPLTYTVTSGPSNGTLDFPNGSLSYPNGQSTSAYANVTYTSTGSFSGSDSFDFTVNDGTTTSAPATISLTVENQAPTLLTPQTDPSSPETSEDTPVDVALRATDLDGQNLTYTITGSTNCQSVLPASQTVAWNVEPTVTVTPTANFNGTATFSWKVSDGVAADVIASTVNVIVNAVNDPPTLNAISDQSTPGNVNKTVNLSGITSGALNESQTLVVTAEVLTNPSLIANLTVNYTSPNTTGTLVIDPTGSGTGVSRIRVTVDDNGGGTETFSREFDITITSY
jgi:large repetitive protein